MNTREKIAALVLCACVGLVLARAGGYSAVGPSKPTLVVMLYEADHGPLPSHAVGAGRVLVEAGIEVRPTDDDVLTGLDQTPSWLVPALEPGRAIMGGSDGKDDALIVLSGTRVVKAVPLPGTLEAIVEAAR